MVLYNLKYLINQKIKLITYLFLLNSIKILIFIKKYIINKL
jgi:hypothetical protein